MAEPKESELNDLFEWHGTCNRIKPVMQNVAVLLTEKCPDCEEAREDLRIMQKRLVEIEKTIPEECVELIERWTLAQEKVDRMRWVLENMGPCDILSDLRDYYADGYNGIMRWYTEWDYLYEVNCTKEMKRVKWHDPHSCFSEVAYRLYRVDWILTHADKKEILAVMLSLFCCSDPVEETMTDWLYRNDGLYGELYCDFDEFLDNELACERDYIVRLLTKDLGRDAKHDPCGAALVEEYDEWFAEYGEPEEEEDARVPDRLPRSPDGPLQDARGPRAEGDGLAEADHSRREVASSRTDGGPTVSARVLQITHANNLKRNFLSNHLFIGGVASMKEKKMRKKALKEWVDTGCTEDVIFWEAWFDRDADGWFVHVEMDRPGHLTRRQELPAGDRSLEQAWKVKCRIESAEEGPFQAVIVDGRSFRWEDATPDDRIFAQVFESKGALVRIRVSSPDMKERWYLDIEDANGRRSRDIPGGWSAANYLARCLDDGEEWSRALAEVMLHGREFLRPEETEQPKNIFNRR